MTATSIPNSIHVITNYKFEGHWWLETPCHDYGQFSELPKAVKFESRSYGRTGWNSDRGIAYYSTRQPFAVILTEQ